MFAHVMQEWSASLCRTLSQGLGYYLSTEGYVHGVSICEPYDLPAVNPLVGGLPKITWHKHIHAVDHLELNSSQANRASAPHFGDETASGLSASASIDPVPVHMREVNVSTAVICSQLQKWLPSWFFGRFYCIL